jgi:hypothetical protein
MAHLIKKILFIYVFGVSSILLLSINLGFGTINKPKLVFKGTVVQIGTYPGFLTGSIVSYQLVKYKIIQVCSGNYSKSEIVVDHLILSGKELTCLKVGDEVYVEIKSNKVFRRYNSNGIRNQSEKIDKFYVAGQVDCEKINSYCQ